MSDTRFIKASVKQFATKNGKDGWSMEIDKKDFNTLPVNEYGKVQLTMRPRKEKSQYGETHYLVENAYKKESNTTTTLDSTDVSTDLPF